MQKLTDYLDKKSFPEPFPEGDTFLDLTSCQIEEVEFTDDNTGEKIIKATIQTKEGQRYFCPNSVLASFKKNLNVGVKSVRLTRSGVGRNTRYIVVKQ